MELQSKIDYSISVIQKAAQQGMKVWLAFSGGKDSQVLYHLAKQSGIEFTPFMTMTSVDPPAVVRFVKEHYPDVKRIPPKISMYDLAVKKRLLPTRKVRWCCSEYKEKPLFTANSVTLLGIRKQESAKRAKRNEWEINNYKFSGTFDMWEEHKEAQVTCMGGKDRILVSPILNWTEKDVWNYLNNVVKVPHCELYDNGNTRVGCIFCPMSTIKHKIKDMKDYPHLLHKWLVVIDRLKEYYKGKDELSEVFCHSSEEIFRWWISGKASNKFLWFDEPNLFNINNIEL